MISISFEFIFLNVMIAFSLQGMTHICMSYDRGKEALIELCQTNKNISSYLVYENQFVCTHGHEFHTNTSSSCMNFLIENCPAK